MGDGRSCCVQVGAGTARGRIVSRGSTLGTCHSPLFMRWDCKGSGGRCVLPGTAPGLLDDLVRRPAVRRVVHLLGDALHRGGLNRGVRRRLSLAAGAFRVIGEPARINRDRFGTLAGRLPKLIHAHRLQRARTVFSRVRPCTR